MRQSIVKSSNIVRKVLIARLNQLNIKPVDVVKDAELRGRPSITKAKLSVYLTKTNPKNGLKEEDIIWLGLRYCIDLTLSVKALTYNEEDAINNLNKYFNDLG